MMRPVDPTRELMSSGPRERVARKLWSEDSMSQASVHSSDMWDRPTTAAHAFCNTSTLGAT